MADTLSKEQRSARMRLIASKDTKPEVLVRRLFLNWAIDFGCTQKNWQVIQISFCRLEERWFLFMDAFGIGIQNADGRECRNLGLSIGCQN